MKSKTLFILLVSLSFALFYYGVQSAYAGTIIVTTTADTDTADGDCSLREAIIAANGDVAYNGCTSGSGNDIIEMTALNGAIILGSHLPIITRTIQFNGPSTNTLTIDGINTYNAIDSTGSGVNIGVDYLTITNVINDGIFATNNITVTNSTIVGGGCGVLSQNGSALVRSSQITGNGCDGVAVENSATITGSTISGLIDGVFSFSGNITVTNSAVTARVDGVYADSGMARVTGSAITAGDDGVDVFSDALVTSSIITATDNGVFAFEGNVEVMSSTITSLTDDGVDADVGFAKVTNSTIFGSESGIDTDTGFVEVTTSQVIGNQDGINAVGNVTVISSTVTGNTLAAVQTNANATVSYSAIINSGGDGVNALTANIFQSTISGNKGDGVQSSNQTSLTVNHSTIVNNTGYGLNNAAGATVVSYTIIAQNDGAGTTRDLNATLSGGSSYNLFGNGDGSGVANGVNGNLAGSTGALLDPKVGLLADNGGPTTGSGQAPKTHALLYGSPALDAIPGGSCPATTDQRGQPRPHNGNCDIGAYETQGSLGVLIYLPLGVK